MLQRADLLVYLEQLLNVAAISDYAPNGLQVEGKKDIKTIVTGVTACQALLDVAHQQAADAIIVHHGYFWRGESSVITGIKRARLGLLMQHNINLLAYHLPLDVHEVLGNNTQLAEILGISIKRRIAVDGIDNLLCQGLLSHDKTGDELSQHLSQQLQRTPLHIAATSRPIRHVAWCTGGAQRYLAQAIDLGVDAYITGEVSENTVHLAREANVHFYAAGHHATERYGIKALGEHLAAHFGIQHIFIDIDNPV